MKIRLPIYMVLFAASMAFLLAGAAAQETASVLVAWEAPAASDPLVESYRIRLGTDADALDHEITFDAPSVPRYLITGLTPGTTYFSTISAANLRGEGPQSEAISFTARTVPDAVPVAPTGVQAVDLAEVDMTKWEEAFTVIVPTGSLIKFYRPKATYVAPTP